MNYELEKIFKDNFINSLIYLKKDIGIKVHLTGILNSNLLKALNIENIEAYFAGFYANIGLLMLEHIVNIDKHLNEKEKEIIKQHVYYSAEFAKRRNLDEAAKIIILHHEKPNGKGYFRKANRDLLSSLLNIADEFVGYSSHSKLRPALTKDIATEYSLKDYQNTGILTKDEIEKIRFILNDFYTEVNPF